MKRALTIGGCIVLLALAGLWLHLTRPFLTYPAPADVTCLDPSRGRFAPLGEPGAVYGLGLSYAGHIAESPGLYDPDAGPPLFRKRPHSVNRTDEIPFPDRATLLAGAANLDGAHAGALNESLGDIPPLLDYEVEVGIAVLEPIAKSSLQDPAFAPPVGFFVANDVTARILIGMSPDFASTVDYLAEGKGLPGFLPVGDRMWVPNVHQANGWVCVELVTEVNGDVRQSASSADIILGPREILLAIANRFDLAGFEPNDWVITGTPPGVALQTPGWIQRAMALVDPSAEIKVGAMAASADAGAFLAPGDTVVVRAGFLGEKRSTVTPPGGPRGT